MPGLVNVIRSCHPSSPEDSEERFGSTPWAGAEHDSAPRPTDDRRLGGAPNVIGHEASFVDDQKIDCPTTDLALTCWHRAHGGSVRKNERRLALIQDCPAQEWRTRRQHRDFFEESPSGDVTG